MPTHNLVHFNLAIARESLDHPRMAGFVEQIEVINQMARNVAGFVCMVDADVDEVARLFGSANALANMTVWRSVDALRAFTYQGSHANALKLRAEWFLPSLGPAYVLWWMPSDERPTLSDAKNRLAHLAADGPTASAFTFASEFAPPSS